MGRLGAEAAKKKAATCAAKTARNKAAFLEVFVKKDGNITKACAGVNINRRHFYVWLSNDPEFAENVKAAKEACKDLFEGFLTRQARSGNVTATLGWLNANARDRGYGINRMEHSGPGGAPIPVQQADLSGKSEDQIRKIMREEVMGRQGKRGG